MAPGELEWRTLKVRIIYLTVSGPMIVFIVCRFPLLTTPYKVIYSASSLPTRHLFFSDAFSRHMSRTQVLAYASFFHEIALVMNSCCSAEKDLPIVSNRSLGIKRAKMTWQLCLRMDSDVMHTLPANAAHILGDILPFDCAYPPLPVRTTNVHFSYPPLV